MRSHQLGILFKVILIVTLLLVLLPTPKMAAATLRTAVSGQTDAGGVATTASNTWQNAIATASLNLGSNNDDVQYVLVAASFECSTAGSYASDAQYKIVNSGDANESQVLQRSLSASRTNDYGIGTLVHIFDVSSLSGSITYTLQHLSTNNNRVATTVGTIIAIPLSTSEATPKHLDNACASISGSDPMNDTLNVWEDVPSSTIGGITLPIAGHLYVAVSLESGQSGNLDNTGQWKLQYRKGSDDWADLGYAHSRSTHSAGDNGLVSLVALKLNQEAGDYSFKLQHRQIYRGHVNARSLTKNFEIVAVALANSSQYFSAFEVYTASPPSITSSDITANTATSTTFTPYTGAKLFVHAQYNMTSGDANAVNTATYDLYIDQTTPSGEAELDSRDQSRYITDNTDTGSGGLVGLSTSLGISTEYTIALRYASDGTHTLVLSDVYLVGFLLGYAVAQAPVPELPTIFLVGIGIAAIVVYVWLTKPRAIAQDVS